MVSGIAVVLVSVGVPTAFFMLVRRLDLYASGSRQVIAWCAAAGLLAFPVSYVVNNAARDAVMLRLGLAPAAAVLVIKTLVAPVVEEIAKSAGLWHAVRRRDFTYFVDGAICGFAAGTAFAVCENLFYASRGGFSSSLGLSINRALSTSLMHGTASALVGVSAGRFRFGRSWTRFVALVMGWGVAFGLHSAFNRVVTGSAFGPAVLAGAVAIGIGGVAMIALIVRFGLREERLWIAESLKLDIGVTGGEARAVDRLAGVATLLAPVEAHFGPARRQQVEALLRSQARLGLKRQAAAKVTDPALSRAILADMAALQAEHDVLRRRIGIYCMSYVRSIMPDENAPLWDRLSQVLADRPASSGPSLWDSMGGRLAAAATEATDAARTDQRADGH